MQIPRLLIAGASSGSGKTSFTLGLTLALRRRGLRVQTFKCGPDYLDPSYHRLASGRPCHNLDSWMMGSRAVVQSFARSCEGADIALIEGVMGLFDGASPVSQEGSSAEIAKILKAPVVAMIDAGGMARTLAALFHGLKTFDPELQLIGCVANQVGSASHGDLLRKALGTAARGSLPRRPDLAFAERHLGLVWAQADEKTHAMCEAWADLIEANIDIDQLLSDARAAPELACEDLASSPTPSVAPRVRIALAMDEAFFFYYEENLHRLRQEGAELLPFSPLRDSSVPEAVDAVYIGGGYPELFAEQLAANEAMHQSLRSFAADGLPIYAECGGLMYLCRFLTTVEGQTFKMVNLLSAAVKMHKRLQALGYVETEITEASPLGPAGTRFRGHQFRYSELEELETLEKIYRVRRKRKGDVILEGYRQGSVVASYVHAHWASHPGIPKFLVENAAKRRI